MRKVLALSICALAFVAGAYAQATAGLGSISGTVRDATGAVMKGCDREQRARDHARSVASGPLPNGRGGVRSLTRPMRVSSTAGWRPAGCR